MSKRSRKQSGKTRRNEPKESGTDPQGEAQAQTSPHEEEEDHAAKAAEYLDLAQRTAAELQNLRQRLAREKDLAAKLAVKEVMTALLPCFDNLDRALEAGEAEDLASVIEGVRMVAAEIHRVLEEKGLSVVKPEKGTRMDPNQHEAVFSRPQEGAEEGTILEVFEKGYRYGDVMIRPARVVVASKEEEPPAEQGSAAATGEETAEEKRQEKRED